MFAQLPESARQTNASLVVPVVVHGRSGDVALRLHRWLCVLRQQHQRAQVLQADRARHAGRHQYCPFPVSRITRLNCCIEISISRPSFFAAFTRTPKSTASGRACCTTASWSSTRHRTACSPSHCKRTTRASARPTSALFDRRWATNSRSSICAVRRCRTIASLAIYHLSRPSRLFRSAKLRPAIVSIVTHRTRLS